MRNRRWWWGGGAAFVVAALIVALLVVTDDGGSDKVASTTSSSTTTTTTPASSSTAATSSTGAPASTTTGSGAAVPPQVTQLAAGPAGGSGEIQLTWTVVTGATGYRVSRSTAASGPFSTSADFNVATGVITKDPTVVNLYANGTSIFYVEVPATTDPHRYYRVTAYNAAGASAPSAVVCGAPVGSPAC